MAVTGGYRQCSRCVLGTTDHADIEFDAEGVCNHCRYFDRQMAALPAGDAARDEAFRRSVARVKAGAKRGKYDSILGISGGVDSSYLAYIARREGLRPLVVHFDNGWNSELAVKNIHSIVEKLGFDLQTYVINWDEFRELQIAYLRASVIDIEVLTDHAIYGALFQMAIDNRIPYVLSGNNVATEGVLPYVWTYDKLDHINIRDIHRKFGRGSVKTYPFVDFAMKRRIRMSNTEVVTLLDFVPYNQAEVKRLLVDELGWRDYGGKHHESIFTRFYQGYILPVKFGVDKRKAHLSSLICSGQITKADALQQLEAPPYDAAQMQRDRDYVLKKLGLTREEFDAIMRAPIRDHREFDTEGSFFSRYRAFRPLQPLWKAVRPLILGSNAGV
ncbi:MAG TPA: N-acetyl sugar amidotransferase [Gemmatimonadaceae bacterium]|nr:N-acetyl sugar amidotransferase [Gemmatimonadaceae bacterium]